MLFAAKAKKWNHPFSPKRILVIRLQAIGDVIITFPFVQQLKDQYPNTRIDFLTRANQVDLARHITAVNKVITFTDSHRRWRQLACTLRLLPQLLLRRYDAVLDLQANTFSKIISRSFVGKTFTEFERFTPFTAAERNLRAIQQTGLISHFKHPVLVLKDNKLGLSMLAEQGWDSQKQLIVLNPAGAFASRHWAPENYVLFARLWLASYPNAQFLVLGTPKIAEKAVFFKQELGDALINLVGQTTLSEAFTILAKTSLVISEDSGLMQMAWALKRPTIALIGSTHKYRSAQEGTHMVILNSDDLPCGNCMQVDCSFGTVPPCLSRYDPAMIVELGKKLLATQWPENELRY
ncbi:glycosyltransferase family 9 protein [Spirosoma foliorum]|uniref:Glycosyltransferase family 9 protein n=1 Tax=Spirosoma foliorum TaxID=2710596 RepID=A0A7G5H621_9BACT|nr:glycosyltransferase family 9 protein [Spirosoma foliorum]QMW06563.1 glycosyltransferase family 9 protein [Spirosoma foliorum]